MRHQASPRFDADSCDKHTFSRARAWASCKGAGDCSPSHCRLPMVKREVQKNRQLRKDGEETYREMCFRGITLWSHRVMRVRIASGIVERVEGIAGGGGEEEGGRGKRGRGMDAGDSERRKKANRREWANCGHARHILGFHSIHRPRHHVHSPPRPRRLTKGKQFLYTSRLPRKDAPPNLRHAQQASEPSITFSPLERPVFLSLDPALFTLRFTSTISCSSSCYVTQLWSSISVSSRRDMTAMLADLGFCPALT